MRNLKTIENRVLAVLKEHPQIVELLDTLDKNGVMKEKNEVQSLVSYIGGMEETLTGMLGELQDCLLYTSDVYKRQMLYFGAQPGIEKFYEKNGCKRSLQSYVIEKERS